MTKPSRHQRNNEFNEMSLEKIEELRSGLKERKGRWRSISKSFSSMPPPCLRQRGIRLSIAWVGGRSCSSPSRSWLYFYEWKLALFTIFLCIFWIGMGSKVRRGGDTQTVL